MMGLRLAGQGEIPPIPNNNVPEIHTPEDKLMSSPPPQWLENIGERREDVTTKSDNARVPVELGDQELVMILGYQS